MEPEARRNGTPSPGRWWWLCVTYLASGLPFGIVTGLLSVHMARLNVREQDAGLVTLFFLPWALKAFWAPWVDRFGGRRVWIVACLLALGVVVAVYAQAVATLPVVARDAVASAPRIAFPWLGWVAVVLITALSATQDVAIDARAVETFPGREEASLAAGVKVGVYRIALLIAGGLLVAMVPRWGWDGVFLGAAALLGALGVTSLFLPAVPRPSLPPMSLWEPLLRLLRRPGFAGVALFVLLYKLGDATLSPMATQFLARANGLHWTDQDMALVRTLSIVTAILGGLVGGWLTKRWGVYRGLWILGGLQAASNLVYAAAAWTRTNEMGWAAVLAESLCAGLGTAPFVALFMISCERGLEGPQYALLSSIFAAAGALAGAFSGYGVHSMGWAPYFALTFVVAAPAFALLPFVKRWLDARAREA